MLANHQELLRQGPGDLVEHESSWKARQLGLWLTLWLWLLQFANLKPLAQSKAKSFSRKQNAWLYGLISNIQVKYPSLFVYIQTIKHGGS